MHRPDPDRLAALVDGWPWPEPPTHWASVPGRTELGGNHTDHQGGWVLAAAVEADLLAVAAVSAEPPGDDGPAIEIESEGFDQPFRVALGNMGAGTLEPRPEERGTTEALVRGVVAGFVARGWPVGGLRARVSSRVGAGEGLSSSAAFEVLVATLLATVCGRGVHGRGVHGRGVHGRGVHGRDGADPLELARLAQEVEIEYFGKPCGLMDQATCALGGVVAFDFRDPASPEVRRTSLELDRWGYSLLLVETGSNHADLTPAYAAVPAEMSAVARLLGHERLATVEPAELLAAAPGIRRELGDRALLRALHFVRETRRVPVQLAALEADDPAAFLRAVRASGRSSWQWLQNISPDATSGGRPEAQPVAVALALADDWLAERAALVGEPEPRGAARIHGGGFAGRIQVYLPTDEVPAFRERVEPILGGAVGGGEFEGSAVLEARLRPWGLAHGRLEAP